MVRESHRDRERKSQRPRGGEEVTEIERGGK